MYSSYFKKMVRSLYNDNDKFVKCVDCAVVVIFVLCKI